MLSVCFRVSSWLWVREQRESTQIDYPVSCHEVCRGMSLALFDDDWGVVCPLYDFYTSCAYSLEGIYQYDFARYLELSLLASYQKKLVLPSCWVHREFLGFPTRSTRSTHTEETWCIPAPVRYQYSLFIIHVLNCLNTGECGKQHPQDTRPKILRGTALLYQDSASQQRDVCTGLYSKPLLKVIRSWIFLLLARNRYGSARMLCCRGPPNKFFVAGASDATVNRKLEFAWDSSNVNGKPLPSRLVISMLSHQLLWNLRRRRRRYRFSLQPHFFPSSSPSSNATATWLRDVNRSHQCHL